VRRVSDNIASPSSLNISVIVVGVLSSVET
jgi:hypothetical protein